MRHAARFAVVAQPHEVVDPVMSNGEQSLRRLSEVALLNALPMMEREVVRRNASANISDSSNAEIANEARGSVRKICRMWEVTATGMLRWPKKNCVR